MDPKLYNAAMNGDLSILDNMSSQETSSLAPQLTPNQSTILHVATEFHQTNFVRTITRDCPLLLRQANSSGDTALHIAAREGFEDIVEIFIDCANILSVDVENGQQELLRMVNLDKDTPLHCAARLGHYESLELLVREDPEVCNFVNNANESPLYLSVSSRKAKVPELIINVASPLTPYKGAKGLTALHPTLFFSKYPLDKIELLVKWRSQMIREGDLLGLTPLHYAALHGRSDAIKLFLQYDTSAIYLLGACGESALHLAAFRGHINALKELINSCPDSCYLIDNKGRTALHAAVLGNRKAVVKFILDTPQLAGLRNKLDKDGNTPQHLAALFKFYDVLGILAKDQKVPLTIVNKEFLTARDIFHKHGLKLIGEQEIRFLKRSSSGAIIMQHNAEKRIKKMNREPVIGAPTKSVNEVNSGSGTQNALEVNLLVATLVATVTFAAGFTMPGGYVNNGPDGGLATLTNKAAFQVFVVFNTLAFCFSVFEVLLHFYASHFRRQIPAITVRQGHAAVYIPIAIIAMVIAFCSGTYVVLSKSTGLSISAFLMCGFFSGIFVYGFRTLSLLDKYQ